MNSRTCRTNKLYMLDSRGSNCRTRLASIPILTSAHAATPGCPRWQTGRKRSRPEAVAERSRADREDLLPAMRLDSRQGMQQEIGYRYLESRRHSILLVLN